MKYILSFLIIFFSVNSSFAQEKKTETITIKTNIYCDHCAQCSSCGSTINDAIRETTGVRKVKINSKENSITVTFSTAKTDADKIRQAISAVGFDADDVPASKDGYAKLDACCKKN